MPRRRVCWRACCVVYESIFFAAHGVTVAIAVCWRFLPLRHDADAATPHAATMLARHADADADAAAYAMPYYEIFRHCHYAMPHAAFDYYDYAADIITILLLRHTLMICRCRLPRYYY